MPERKAGWSGWIQTGISICGVAIAVAGWIFLGGASSQKLEDHTRRIELLEVGQHQDHDAVTRMVENVEFIKKWVDAQQQPRPANK